MPYPANSSQYELNTFTPIKHREREREKIPWQRKTRAFGEEKGNHLHVKSCTPLEFLLYS
jgi:hypothetical protein